MWRFLLLEDDPIDAQLIQQVLIASNLEYEIVWAKTRAEFLAALDSSIDLILADYHLPEFTGLEALKFASQRYSEIPFIIVSASLGEELAIEMLKQGATDYVLKQRLGRLLPSVQRALREVQERRERQQAEQERERFLAISSDLQIIIDFNHQLKWISPSFEQILGWTVTEMAGQPWFNFAHPDNIDGFHQSSSNILRDDRPFSFENRYRHKNGSYRWFLWNVQRYSEERLIYAVAVDITDRKQVEEALLASEERFRLIVESAKEYAIFTLDLNGVVTSWNSGAQRLLGYQESEIVGCNGRIIFAPEDNERGEAERERYLTLTQGRAENERWHVRKEGSRFWASGLMMPLQNEAGVTQGFIKILQDKTAQQQANWRLHLLYETTRDLLATEQPIQLMNNLFNKLSSQLDLQVYYNYMVEVIDHRSMLHLRNYGGFSDEAAQSIAWIEMGQYLCGVVAQERRPLILDRSQISTYANAQLLYSIGLTAYAGYPLMAQGQLLGTLSFASFTRTHFTPEEIDLLQSTCEQIAIALERANLITSIQQQAERLQEANRIKDEFLAVLSHELRSPLNPILGWTRLLQSGKLDAARQIEALAAIERNAKLQTQLIEDLLDISRIMQGKLTLTAAPVNLTSVISAAVETVRLAAEAKSIDLRFTILGSEGEEQIHSLESTAAEFGNQPKSKIQNPKFTVLGDATRLQQVLWNLLTNAVKFTSHGGQVVIELQSLSQLAEIRVIDSGKGISPSFLPHVFEYFRQADSTATRRFGGLGLGLAIVRQIVEMHGGTVKAESAGENQGATFTVQLPVIQQGLPAALESTDAEADSIETPCSNLKILVVDDDADTREFQKFLLEQLGARVTAVASGLEALEALDRFIPDVIVSDIGMADMDGYMLMQQIRARSSNRGGQIPAIALTAYAREFDHQKALQAGFQTHITKPVELETLIEAIAKLVDS